MISQVDGRAGRWSSAVTGLLRKIKRDGTIPLARVAAASAHRTLALVDRLIRRLDRLEFGEQDPARLSDLFELDHLVTQIRHNEESLLVLAGADSARVRRGAESLTDVLRAAQSEVEQYTRIDIHVTDLDLRVAAGAANDLVHLVAELLDNATSYSLPDTTVTVEAGKHDGGVLISIADRGVGIDAGKLRSLNARLAGGAGEGMLGLAVVARLAARHGISVTLRPDEDGTVAEVSIPAKLIVVANTVPEAVVASDAALALVPEPSPALSERVRAAAGTMTRAPVEPDDDGDLRLRVGSAEIVVRVKENPPMVDVLSPLRTEVEPSEELSAKLSELTAGMPVGRLFWAGGTVWGSVPVFGHDFQETHLKLAVQVMTGLATETKLQEEWP